MSDSLVSVVIPSYDRPEPVSEALESVEEQTHDEIEVIVVDDCSPTPLRNLLGDRLDAFEHPIRLIRHNENKGASAARNTGIQHATGDYIAFLDDDDRWDPRKLCRQLRRFEATDESVGLVYTGMRVVDENGRVLRTHSSNISGTVTRDLLCRNFIGSFSVVMVKAKAIDDVGRLDDQFPAWQDIEWYVRLSTEWEFFPVKESLVTIRQASGHPQISDDFDRIERAATEMFVPKYQPLAQSCGPLFERKFRGWISFRLGAYNALRTGRFNAARHYLFDAIRAYPFEPVFWLYLAVALGGATTYELAKSAKRTFDG